MYQAGIKNIILYENKGITFRYYDPLNTAAITALESKGRVVQVLNLQRPEFDIKLKFSKSGLLGSDYKVIFLLLGLTLENYEQLNEFATSINGWCFLVEFYDGSFKFYNTPVFCRESEIKPQDEMSWKVTLETAVPTTKSYLEYTPGISLNPVYRADTTLITADSEIYSADYEL
jgi:hypothetical protein